MTAGYPIQNGLLEVIVQPHAIGHMQPMRAGLLIGHQALLELEVRAIIAVLTHLRVVPFVFPALRIWSMHGIGVDGLHIETDVRSQTRLMQQQLANGNVTLVRTAQEGEIGRSLVVQFQLAFIIELSEEFGCSGFVHCGSGP